ncbi:MAG: zinc-dependent metalloprotease family protein, partial [Nodosilinea sp.]
MVNLPFQPRFLLVCGLSAALVSCTGEGQGSSGPTRFVSIQPIQVCDDFGLFCADLATFEDATRKIWAQANLDVSFLAPNRLNASRFLTIDSQDEFEELSFAGGAGAFGRNPLSTRTAGPISLWFVESIFPFEGFDTLGLGWIGQNGIVIDDEILAFNNGVGRLDTVAHEIGHNLGLTHAGFGAGDANNLMTDGSFRNSPSTLDDITPDGANLDRLTNRQIEVVRDSRLTRSSPGLAADSIPATGSETPLLADEPALL